MRAGLRGVACFRQVLEELSLSSSPLKKSLFAEGLAFAFLQRIISLSLERSLRRRALDGGELRYLRHKTNGALLSLRAADAPSRFPPRHLSHNQNCRHSTWTRRSRVDRVEGVARRALAREVRAEGGDACFGEISLCFVRVLLFRHRARAGEEARLLLALDQLVVHRLEAAEDLRSGRYALSIHSRERHEKIWNA